MMRIFLALILATAAHASCPSGYIYSRSITVQSGQITGTLSSFPMLVLNPSASLKTTGNAGHVENSNGYDIVFSTTGGSLLPFELVGHGGAATTYVASSGNGEWWVNVSSIANGTAINLCYGNAAISTYQGSDAGTWNSAYIAVLHHGTNSTLTITDSTGINTPSNTNTVTNGTGKIDGGATFVSASSQNVDLGTNSALNPTAISYVAWYKATSLSSAYSSIAQKVNGDSSAYSEILVKSNGKLAAYVRGVNIAACAAGDTNYDGTGSSTLSTGTFYHLAMTYDSSTGLIGYVNGAQDGTAAAKGNLCSNTGNTLEGNAVDGIVDELEISNIARPAAWITAQYNNQSAPGSFYAVGSETSPSASFTISPILLPASNAADIVVSLTGSGTAWDGTTVITASGVSGTSCGAVTVTGSTAATVICTTGATTGTLTLTESVTGGSVATVPVGGAGGVHGFVGG